MVEVMECLVSTRVGRGAILGGDADEFHGSGTEIAVELADLGNAGACSGLALMLAIDAGTGMVSGYRLVQRPGGVKDAARTVIDALRELHVPNSAEISVTCGPFPTSALIAEIRRLSGRVGITADPAWARRLEFDRIATDLGRHVGATAAFEMATGSVRFDHPDDRLFFLESVVDQVLHWHHRRPLAGHGSSSPIERFAATRAGRQVASRRD